MDHPVLKYLQTMSIPERERLCERCGTTYGYVRKACYAGQQLGAAICVELEKQTQGDLRLEKMFPDVDWKYVRKTSW